MNTAMPKIRLEMPMIGPRRYRSASQPIGTAPSTMNAPAAALRNTIIPSLMWNVARCRAPTPPAPRPRVRRTS